MKNVIKHLMAATALSVLAACGGGGGSSTPTPTVTPLNLPAAEGIFTGTIAGSPNNAFNLVVLENGDFWTLYGKQVPTGLSVVGIVQGTGTSSNSSFTSSNAKDFGFLPAINTTVSATYNPIVQTISGTLSSTAGNATFSGGQLTGSTYSYATPAALSSITGAWTTTSTSGENVSINVATSGAFTAIGSSGCGFSGTITPRPSGKNVFNTAMTFGPAPCGLPGQTASGIAIVYPLTTGKTQVILAQVDATRSFGSAAFGVR